VGRSERNKPGDMRNKGRKATDQPKSVTDLAGNPTDKGRKVMKVPRSVR
jgi:hypothetical protein